MYLFMNTSYKDKMHTHKKVIKWIIIVTILLSYIAVVIDFNIYPEIEEKVIAELAFLNGKRQYFVSVLHGMITSLLISLGIEIVNYFTSKEEQVREFIAKTCEVNQIFNKLSNEIQGKHRIEELVSIYEEIRSIKIYEFKLCIARIDFWIRRDEKKLIEQISNEILTYWSKVNNLMQKIDNCKSEESINKFLQQLITDFVKVEEIVANGTQLNVSYLDVVVDADIKRLENIFWKTVWYKEKSFFVPKIHYVVTVYKWYREEIERGHNVFFYPEYGESKKIPFLNYRVKIDKPINIDVKRKKYMKFRKYSDKYVENKMMQYEVVVSEVDRVLEKVGLENNEASFEIAKDLILNNEEMSIWKAIKLAIKDFFCVLNEWIPIVASFLLGLFTEKISNNPVNKKYWVVVLLIVMLGYIIHIVLKCISEPMDKLNIRILKNLSYNKYKSLKNSKIFKDEFNKIND